MEIKNIAFASFIIVCLAVSYYFIIALPSQNKAKIELEKQKFEMDKQKTEREEQEKKVQESQREMKLLSCRVAAEEAGNKHLELNGIPVSGQPNVYRASPDVINRKHQIIKEGLDDCERTYGSHR